MRKKEQLYEIGNIRSYKRRVTHTDRQIGRQKQADKDWKIESGRQSLKDRERQAETDGNWHTATEEIRQSQTDRDRRTNRSKQTETDRQTEANRQRQSDK